MSLCYKKTTHQEMTLTRQECRWGAEEVNTCFILFYKIILSVLAHSTVKCQSSRLQMNISVKTQTKTAISDM